MGGEYDDKKINLLDNSEISEKSNANLYRNFIIMCIAFSLNHGAVVSCLAYATAELGNDLGGYGSGTLYVFYSITALLFSKPIVSMVGPKKGLILGVGGYCVYVAGFLFAIMVPAASWPVFLLSCAIGIILLLYCYYYILLYIIIYYYILLYIIIYYFIKL
jgi:hypothetical protein